jgi:hypothetical protein
MFVAEEESELELENVNVVLKSKRGRKSKKELMESLNMLNFENHIAKPVKIPKKHKTLEEKKLKHESKEHKSEKNKYGECKSKECKSKECKSKECKSGEYESGEYESGEYEYKENKYGECECKENKYGENEYKENDDHNKITTSEPKVFKKRGRKPKGGKIIQQTIIDNEEIDEKQYVILHLKCSIDDLENANNDEGTNVLDAYNTHIYSDCYQPLDESKTLTLTNSNVNSNLNINNCDDGFEVDDDETDVCENSKYNMKEIWKKLKQLECNLHIDNISKKSACFWDTCDFDTPPIYIPKYFLGGTYYVYGCFCCPECAIAYLNNQQVDRSTKSERYQLIHDVYSKMYGYTKSIKEASDPRYLLDIFFGNLSIKEYRALLRSETLYLVIDKPLTKVYPEIHEDTEDYILNNKIIPSNTSSYQIRGKNGRKKANKSSILSENFGIN